MSRGSLFFVWSVDVVYTDVMWNTSPTLAFLRGIDFGWLGMVWGGIYHGLNSPMIVIANNLTDVRYRDEILRLVAVPFVQQHHLILQQDNARPHVTRVCQDFSPIITLTHSIGLCTVQICPQSNICGTKWTGE